MKKYYILFLAVFFGLYVSGQSISSYVVASAGESVEAGGLNVSWTLGEIAIETLEDDGNTLILTQGFQQAYFDITSIEDPLLSGNFNLKVYPNPASDFVWVELESEEINEAIVELYDLNGKLVYNSKLNITEVRTQISLTNLSSSQYILKISDSSGEVLHTYKLIKR
ncbi:MAG: T9SS type A sorting domain-containing protein [Bacteroidales bacterium]|jgi:hypothetical protein|nr:T9SS type A sorting domain-containing protein [Bacteroidales bacterium]